MCAGEEGSDSESMQVVEPVRFVLQHHGRAGRRREGSGWVSDRKRYVVPGV